MTSSITAPTTSTMASPTTHWIELKDISYTFPKSLQPTLQLVNLTIQQGESVGLIGVNGSGKTTLLKILASLLQPTQGSVLFRGTQIQQQLKDYRAGLNYSAGAPLGFYPRLTAIENLVLFANFKGHDLTVPETTNILQRVALPESSFHTVYNKFSLGMRQRLHIARSLLNPCHLLLMDEPTNGLDEAGHKLLIEVLTKDLAAKSKFLISHDSRFLEAVCSKLYHLDGGRLKEAAR